jgi:uridine phosphorylase
MEHIIVMGAEKFVIFGCCGVLDSRINDLGIIIPTAAVRDEGCSYHYLEASREINVNTNKKHLKLFKEILKEHNYTYVEGKTWTTDAIFRETRDKVLKRKEEGCICVDMECSSIFALMKFRGKECFQFFYAADNLDAQKWDSRSLIGNVKIPEKAYIGLLAFEMAINMEN